MSSGSPAWYDPKQQVTNMVRRVEVPGVVSLHNRLKRDRGKASAYTCSCGEPAQEWAYDHKDPNELIGTKNGRQVPYSLNYNHYQPMCKPCHRKLDYKPKPERFCSKPGCPKKHWANGFCVNHNRTEKRGYVKPETCGNCGAADWYRYPDNQGYLIRKCRPCHLARMKMRYRGKGAK